MEVTRQAVWELCKQIAPRYQFDPYLIMAICEQETEKSKTLPYVYRPDVARLEQNFYRKYVEPTSLSTVVEVLLSASYGIMQMMGQSLFEGGYFAWHFSQQGEPYKQFFHDPMMNMAVAKAIDEYCVRPEWNVDWGCKHLSGKRARAKGNINLALCYWNGDLTGGYTKEVNGRIPGLMKEFKV